MTLKTGSKPGAGTDGPVMLNIKDANKDETGWLLCTTSNSHLKAGSSVEFEFDAPLVDGIEVIEVVPSISYTRSQPD